MRQRVPEWYRDAKLGIMVHWGVPTVPAYAPTEDGGPVDVLRAHDWQYYFLKNPRAEWYLNSLRIPGSPVRSYHRTHFGRYTSYERLARRFNEGLASWDPNEWADLFAEAGARYVVMVSKHHDGFLMWPSATRPPGENFVASRDIVGELAAAVRSRGMKYGISYSGRLDWTVQTVPIRDAPDLVLPGAGPQYGRYALSHFHELIERFSPDLLRNEVGLPPGVSRRKLFARFRHVVPEGVLSGRWRKAGPGARFLLRIEPARKLLSRAARKAAIAGRADDRTGDVPSIEYVVPSSSRGRPWELVRGLGHSFARNHAEPDTSCLTGPHLIHLLVDVVSRNGNLLLNVAPDADGSISRPQRDALASLSSWLRDHGEAIFGTRPWRVAGTTTQDGISVRYTATESALYAIVLGRPRMLSVAIRGLDPSRVPRPRAGRRTDQFVVRLLGTEREVEWRVEDRSVVVDIPGSFIPSDAMVIEFAWRQPAAETTSNFYTDII